MKLFSLVLAVFLAGCTTFQKSPFRADLNQIHSASVFVRTADGSSGSGSVFRSKNGEYLILTAAHVVWDSPSEPVIISQAILLDGQKIGEFTTLADVIVANHPYYGLDIAVLRPRDLFFTKVVRFYVGESVPAVGTPIIHCGSPHGAWLERSITFGHIAGLNRRRTETAPQSLDQSTVTVLPGSSGGGVFLATTGEFVGFIDEWEGFDNVNFFVPVRDILRFLREENLLDK